MISMEMFFLHLTQDDATFIVVDCEILLSSSLWQTEKFETLLIEP